MILSFNCYTFRKCFIKVLANIASNRSSINLIIVVLLIKQSKNIHFNLQRISKSVHILSVCKSANSLNRPVLGGLNDQNTVLQLRSYVASYTIQLPSEVSLKLQFYSSNPPNFSFLLPQLIIM